MRAVVTLCWLVPLCAAAGAFPADAQQSGAGSPEGPTLVIEHVAVVDVERGRLVPDRRVVVAGRRISVVDAGRVSIRQTGARVVDGRGKYLMPGLWDMHVHTLPGPARPHAFMNFFPLYVANGVTGVRQMGDPLGGLVAARSGGLRAAPATPRLVATGSMLDGPDPQVPINAIAVPTPADAPRIVDSVADAGADFIKVYSGLSRATYAAIVAAARRHRLPVAGHVPADVPIDSAAAAGQRSIEHMLEIFIACSADEDSLRRVLAAGFDTAHARQPVLFRVRVAVRARALASVDWPRCRALFRRLARRDTWVTPTLVASEDMVDTSRLGDPRLRYFEPPTVAAWRAAPRVGTTVRPLTETAPYIREMARAGVRLLAGTDVPVFVTLPGFDLHSELALLVEAGLTPSAALRTATLEPARYLEATDSLGTIAVGKLADLVLLDADPLKDIHSTTKIRGVVVNGRFFDRAALDALLAEVERAVGTAAR